MRVFTDLYRCPVQEGPMVYRRATVVNLFDSPTLPGPAEHFLARSVISYVVVGPDLLTESS